MGQPSVTYYHWKNLYCLAYLITRHRGGISFTFASSEKSLTHPAVQSPCTETSGPSSVPCIEKAPDCALLVHTCTTTIGCTHQVGCTHQADGQSRPTKPLTHFRLLLENIGYTQWLLLLPFSVYAGTVSKFQKRNVPFFETTVRVGQPSVIYYQRKKLALPNISYYSS